MSRRNSPEDNILGWIIAILIIIGFIIKLAQALFIPILLLSIIFIMIGFLFKEDIFLKFGGIGLIIVFALFLIGFIFGNSEIGEQSQEIYLMAVNTSKSLRFNQ